MERLQKVLAQNGCGSRRDCEDLIREGRVSVDGETVTELGLHVDPDRQTIKVDGTRLKIVPARYFLLNKPRGVVCTLAEDERAPRAVDLAPRGVGRVYTIGRLDKDSEGLIILTNDGDLCERLTHPRHDMPKTYHVTVRGGISSEAIAKLRRGVWLSEGKARVSSVRVLRHSPFATLLEVELREGKNREIRRIMAKVGHPVKALRRVAIGPLRISGIAPGKTRPLTSEEVAVLREAVGRGGGAEAAGSAKATPKGKSKAKSAGSERGPHPLRREDLPTFEPVKIVKRGGKGAGTPPLPRPSAPPAPRAPARYEPDAEGVIVVRRPAARRSPEEE